MQYDAEIDNFQHHLDGKNTGERVVEVIEDLVPRRVLPDGILGGQRDTRQRYHQHYEEVEVPKVHDPVGGSSYATNRRLFTNELSCLEEQSLFRINIIKQILRIRRGQYKHGGVWQHWFWSRVVVFILPPFFGRLIFTSSVSEKQR